MRLFHIQDDQFVELLAMPDMPPARGYLWLGIDRQEFDAKLASLQIALQQWTGGQLFEPHIAALLNAQLPSHFDYTSWYDLLVFRGLKAPVAPLVASTDAPTEQSPPVDSDPVGFVVFDQVLLTVHTHDCEVREFFANRLAKQASGEARAIARIPPSPAELALRMVNHMVDNYLDLRRQLTRQFARLQEGLFFGAAYFSNWKLLLEARSGLRVLEDTCEDQRAAVTEWIDAIDELPRSDDPIVLRERDLMRVRAREILEHIERILSHLRRLESSAENAVQMHFATQNHRTNEIMRTLTVLTAVFLPLNFVTGFFGMNFDGLPLIHNVHGFWWTIGFMAVVGVGLSWYFWRKRLLSRPH